MKFAISRTSVWSDDENPPCKEAFRDDYTRLDIRNVNDPEKVPAFRGQRERWFKEGKNHRVERGHIIREFEDTDWFVEVNSLDDLIAFCKKYGRVIISPFLFNENIWSIEIYDGYRE